MRCLCSASAQPPQATQLWENSAGTLCTGSQPCRGFYSMSTHRNTFATQFFLATWAWCVPCTASAPSMEAICSDPFGTAMMQGPAAGTAGHLWTTQGSLLPQGWKQTFTEESKLSVHWLKLTQIVRHILFSNHQATVQIIFDEWKEKIEFTSNLLL